MTRLLTCGYETGDVNEAGVSVNDTFGTLSVVSSTPTPRSPGAYCLKLATSASSSNHAYKAFTLPATKTETWVRFAYFAHYDPGHVDVIASWWDSVGATQTSITYDTSDGLLRLYRGDGAGTLLGTASLSFPEETWHTIDWRTQILTSTTGASEVWLDGTRVINFSGDNTNTATLNVQRLNIGHITSGSFSTTYLGIDDIAINDTAGSSNNGRIGDGRIVLLKPNGAGSNTGLTRGGTDTGANWSQVSEVPMSMTQYVQSATEGLRDTYALENLPSAASGTAYTVNACEVLALALNSDAGAGSLGLTVKSGSTTNEGTAQSLSTAAAYLRQLYETDPATSVAWTLAAVDALEAGITVR